MSITIDIKADKLLKDLSDDLVDEEGLIRELTLKGEGYCKSEAPKDTGDLSRSISSRFEGDNGIVKTDIEYARHVIYGTRVMHPGTRPNNFPARAVKKVRGEIPGIVPKYMRVKS